MFGKVFVIVSILCFNYASGTSHSKEIDSSSCKSLITQSYEYSPIPIDQIINTGEIYLEFYVKAERDAHIIFSPSEVPAKKGQKAYEIVLGADKNSYSVIRSSRAGKDMEKDFQGGIVSPNEWRKFWIRICSNGLIEVGKNESSPFLSWRDDDRMNIDHFGFASWSDGNKVHWQIECRQSNASVVDETEKKLVQNLFSNYNKSAPPQNRILLDEINITVTSQYAYERNASLEIVGLAKIVWKDNRLRWNSTSYNNSKDFDVEYDSIWKPNVTIKNDQPCGNKSLDTGYVILSHEGIVSWTTLLHIKLSCYPKGHYKLGSQVTCPIKLPYIANKLNLEVHNNFEKPSPSPFSCTKVEDFKNEYPEFQAKLIFRRRGK